MYGSKYSYILGKSKTINQGGIKILEKCMGPSKHKCCKTKKITDRTVDGAVIA